MTVAADCALAALALLAASESRFVPSQEARDLGRRGIRLATRAADLTEPASWRTPQDKDAT